MLFSDLFVPPALHLPVEDYHCRNRCCLIGAWECQPYLWKRRKQTCCKIAYWRFLMNHSFCQYVGIASVILRPLSAGQSELLVFVSSLVTSRCLLVRGSRC